MIGPRNVHPDELGDAEGMEIQDAIRVGNRLIEGIDDLSIGSSEDFADRVMAALADEPTPGTTGFLAPLRRRGFPAGLIASVRQAWAAARTGRPMLGRSAALAYVLAVVVAGVSLTGVVTLGGAGALGLFNPTPTQSPPPAVPQPTLAPTAPEPTIAPPPSPEASEPPVGPTPSPTETENEPEGSDDNGGNSGPGGGGSDNSGPGGGGGDDDSSGSGGKSGSGDNSGSGSSGAGSDDSGSGSSGSRSGSRSGSGSDDSGSDDAGRR